MLALGIILVLIAVGLVFAAMFGGGSQPANFDLGAVQGEASTFAVFLAGALTLLLLLAGLAMISGGLRRARRRRQEKKELNRLSEKVQAQEAAASPTATRAEHPTGTAAGSGRAADTTAGPPTTADTPTTADPGATADPTLTDQDRPKA